MSDGLKVIAAAIAVSSASSLISIPVEMFLDTERTALDFVRQHHRQYRELPALQTVQEEAGVRFPSVPESLDFYVDRIYERHEYNQIRDRFAGLRDGLAQMDMSAVSEAVRDMHRVTRQRNRRGQEVVTLSEAGQMVQDRLIQTRGYGGITGIETGWPVFDQTTGGYQRGDLISWVGRPELGKTYLILRQAWKAHEAGANVLFVTTEMTAEQIGRRHAAIALGINPQVLKNNTVSTYLERRLRSFYRDMVGSDGFRIFSVGMNSPVSSVEAFMQEFDPDLVVVDGAYLLKPSQPGRNMSRTEKITGVFDELKALTLETNRPFVVSTQFNRGAGKGGADGSLENIGYTDAIGTHSSIVASIRFGPTTNPRASRWIQFLKGREGEQGRIAINFKFAPLDMEEFTPDETGTEASSGAPNVSADVNWMA